MKRSLFLLILAMSLTLSLGMLWAGPSPAGANEQLAQLPSLTDKDGSWNNDYPAQLAAWFNDHFFLRQQLISLNNRLRSGVFATSGEDSVVLGKDGWLFYASTLADYTGQDPMTPQELQAAAGNLALMAEYRAQAGKDFLFVIAPNKNSLYPQYMPSMPQFSSSRNAQSLLALLGETEVTTVDLYALFSQAETPLYFATDSHWNSQGAALAADAINEALGVNSTYAAGPFRDSPGYTGDLFSMLYPGFTGRETQPLYAGALTFTYTSAAQKADSITLETAGSGTDSLLVYRDSFGNLLYPYLADSYAAARFSRSTVYDLMVEADHLVIELVERNLSYLITYVPVMPAPQRTLSLPQARQTGTIQAQPQSKTPEGYCLWRGQIPQGDGPVYVQCGQRVYEAFRLEGGVFTLHLPQEEIPKIAACQVNGSMVSYTLEIS